MNSLRVQPEAVIFDLDGVMTDTAEYHFLAWKALAEDLGIAINRAFNQRLKGIGRMESLELILEHAGMAEQFSTEEKEKWAAKKNDHYKKLIRLITPRDLLPGIEPFMKAIKQHGIKIGLASASRNALSVLESLQITAWFDGIVDAGKIARGKPDPEIFLTAAQLLSVRPDRCVGIEDAVSGIRAINRAGMFSIGVGDTRVLHEADYVVTSTAELDLQDVISRFHAWKT